MMMMTTNECTNNGGFNVCCMSLSVCYSDAKPAIVLSQAERSRILKLLGSILENVDFSEQLAP